MCNKNSTIYKSIVLDYGVTILWRGRPLLCFGAQPSLSQMLCPLQFDWWKLTERPNRTQVPCCWSEKIEVGWAQAQFASAATASYWLSCWRLRWWSLCCRRWLVFSYAIVCDSGTRECISDAWHWSKHETLLPDELVVWISTINYETLRERFLLRTLW